MPLLFWRVNKMPDSVIEYFITGGSWISSSAYSLFSEHKKAAFDADNILSVPKELFTSEQVGRYGRFDPYTRAGFSAAGLALKDAGFSGKKELLKSCGVIVSSVSGSSVNDLEYYKTAVKDGGLASPNLFSYTLPGIMPGECAVHFKLMGPAFCVSDGIPFGIQALLSACAMIYSGAAERMLAGAVEVPCMDGRSLQGAVFLMLSKEPETEHAVKITYDILSLRICKNNTEVKNITELF